MTKNAFARRLHDIMTAVVARPTPSLQQLNVLFVHHGLFGVEMSQFQPLLDALSARPVEDSTDIPSKITFCYGLQRDYLSADHRLYESVRAESWRLVSQDKERRSAFMSERWQHDGKPAREMSPLPTCKTGAAFVRIDQKAIRKLFGCALKDCGGPWWYQDFFDVFSKRANIPCLRGSGGQYARSEHGAFIALKKTQQQAAIRATLCDPDAIAAFDATALRCPLFVDASFLTDGVQVKLHLVTSALDNGGAPGLWGLAKAGYRALGSMPRTMREIIDIGHGVYNVEAITSESLSDLDGVIVSAFDPGQEWRRPNAAALMSTATRRGFAGDRYQDGTLAKLSEQKEEKRRRDNAAYGGALDALTGQRRRTSALAEYTAYCRAWAHESPHLFEELLQDTRRHHAFRRYSSVQRAVAAVADAMVPVEERGKRRVVFFGAASFQAKSGCASAPRKKIIRECCQNFVVVMVGEAYTSITCPGCRRETIEEGYRNRTCITNPGVAGTICPLHPDTAHAVFNRDVAGAVNIGLRGVYRSAAQEPEGDRPLG
ncbi:hypothetical protein JKP88DRAFT_285290 [Tribonema minus]|uniref:Transposase n=1 Tax=Tribonema minus TaxID=303371 RepID=A0A835ZCL1_9STRA|nr:hypothetical protein JKP88DRAFT_285290 [Tribonema minus]